MQRSVRTAFISLILSFLLFYRCALSASPQHLYAHQTLLVDHTALVNHTALVDHAVLVEHNLLRDMGKRPGGLLW